MSDAEQIDAFHRDLRALVARYRSEFELTVAAAIGTLEIVKLQLWDEEKDNGEDDE